MDEVFVDAVGVECEVLRQGWTRRSLVLHHRVDLQAGLAGEGLQGVLGSYL